MHDHDLDVGADGGPGAVHRHDDDREGLTEGDIGRGVEAGRRRARPWARGNAPSPLPLRLP